MYKSDANLLIEKTNKLKISSKNFQKNFQEYPNESISIFIVGLPRSGTSLVEQILSSKKEIKRLIGLTSTKGNTLIATKVFEKNGFIKVEVALAKGKKDYDKRKKIDD